MVVFLRHKLHGVMGIICSQINIICNLNSIIFSKGFQDVTENYYQVFVCKWVVLFGSVNFGIPSINPASIFEAPVVRSWTCISSNYMLVHTRKYHNIVILI